MAVQGDHTHGEGTGGKTSDPPVAQVQKVEDSANVSSKVSLSPESPPFYPVKPVASKNPEEEYDEDTKNSSAQVVLKFLIGTEAAGAVIGKHGSTVSELETSSGVKIQLSRTHEYFPGTAKRTIALCGTVDQTLVAMYLCLTKVEADDVTMLGQHPAGPTTQIALIVPDNVCGSIIGRGGATLKSFMDDSGAKLVVSSNDRCGERIIYITGSKDQQVRAAALISTQMIQHPSYIPEDVPLSYPPVHHEHHAEAPHDTNPCSGHHREVQHNHEDHETKSFILPDECVGVVIGKHGATIQLIRDRTGAMVKVEDSNGSGSRKVTASGSPEALAEVDTMLLQLVTAWGIQDGPVDGRSSLDGGHRRGSMDVSRRSSATGSRRNSLDTSRHHPASSADKQNTWRSSGGGEACSSRLSLDSRRSLDYQKQGGHHHHGHGHSHGHGHGHSGSNNNSRRSSIDQQNWRTGRASLDLVPEGSKAADVLQKNWPGMSEQTPKIDEKKVMESAFYA